uniref:Uncharacterized protein n=1 Tax=Nelumbo nucifera TaxID=4432 RepID=A0A822ZVG3_NELNU|nr:TPA_asm: hypothetical protein HUJ06_018426 [Nelumbo nucifera]
MINQMVVSQFFAKELVFELRDEKFTINGRSFRRQ